jgi:pre-mRNA-splicing factor SYF1
MDVRDVDLSYEEDVLQNPYSLKSWLRYLVFKINAPPHIRFVLYERALVHLPGSYKLWHSYLTEKTAAIRGKFPLDDPTYEALNKTFERALVYMHKMPRIWMDYCSVLTEQHKITFTRHTFDRALRSLPVTQHDRIWKLYIPWVCKTGVPETAMRVYRRYLKIEPEAMEDYIDYLTSVGCYNEAAHKLAALVNDEDFVSEKGLSHHQLWVKLCEMLSKQPKQITGIKVDAIIREGIRRFTNEVGRLWVSLAEYYIRLGNFEKARDIFEEGIHTVMTVRDFTQIWDAYTRFEDSIIEAQMQSADDEEDLDFELRIARYENLINQRPLLLSSVLLRQNPHNVNEWHKRVKLFPDDPVQAAKVYAEAVKTVDPKLATGKPHTLWVGYARLYERNDDIETSRAIFRKATQVDFKSVDHLASVWCEFAEMELRNKNYEAGLKLLQTACNAPRSRLMRGGGGGGAGGGDLSTQQRLYKSTKLWAMYADLEESLGTFHSTKAVYDKILDLRIATPQIILNYAAFLEEHRHFEDSFKAYEKGISLFQYPYVFDLWVAYLTKFVERYGNTKLERARDLFEDAIDGVPAKYAKTLYIMYAHLEEEFGLARHAMNIYDRATRVVSDDDKPYIYAIYIARATQFFGVTKTREIYEQAIANLPDKFLKEMCLKYADLERKLGEIDRARAIYMHASQFCDPSMDTEFWKIWRAFEIRHGNADTFREMLRVERSVQATYNTQINLMSAQMLAASKKDEDAARRERLLAAGAPEDEMAALERQAMAETERETVAETRRPMVAAPGASVAFTSGGFETATTRPSGARMENVEEIDLAEMGTEGEGAAEGEEEGEEEEPSTKIVQKSVPSAVFGSLKKEDKGKEKDEEEEREKKPMGALARLKRGNK